MILHILCAPDQTMGNIVNSLFNIQRKVQKTNFVQNRTQIYLDGNQVVNNDRVHVADSRVCASLLLSVGIHALHVLGFEYNTNSEVEITYSGPDTFGVRTVVGGQPFANGCDPRSPTSAVNSFTLCTFKSDPTTAFNGDCTPTVGNAHPRWPGPCAKAIGTSSYYFPWYSGGWLVPVLGSADEQWVGCK